MKFRTNQNSLEPQCATKKLQALSSLANMTHGKETAGSELMGKYDHPFNQLVTSILVIKELK